MTWDETGRRAAASMAVVATAVLAACGSPSTPTTSIQPPITASLSLHATWTDVTNNKAQIGRALRLVASGGWATEDPDVMAELLDRAERLATAVVADPGASPNVRDLAQNVLDRVKLDLPD